MRCSAENTLHAHRIRVLILPALDVPSPGSYLSVNPDITPFLPLLNTPLPALKTLVAYVKRSIRYDPPAPPQFEIFTTHLPSLRTLRISRVSVPWSTGLLSGLTTLDLRACTFSGTSPSPDQFLDVLECCTALKELRLLDVTVSAVIGPHIANIAMSNPDRVIRLPKLQTIKLADLPSTTTWLSCRLTFHPGMCITVTGWLPDDLNVHFNSAFASLIPHHELLPSLFPTSTPIHGYIRMMPDFAELSVQAIGGATKLSLRLQSRGREEWDVYLQHALRDFCALFSGLPIQRLDISGFWEFAARLPAWVDLLYGLPELRALQITGRGPVYTLFRALKCMPMVAHAGGQAAAGGNFDHPRAPPCPKLRKRIPPEEDDIERLVAVLHRRAHFKLARMEVIELYL